MLIYIFLIWKLIDILVTIISPYFIPYLGFFSYGDTMFKYNLPHFIRVLSNFDGIFFIRIAMQGYSDTEQAYFPLYPLFIKYVNILFHNPIVSGVIISNIAFACGFIIFKKYLQLITQKSNVAWIILFLMVYPTSYYFGVMYTESLFFVLFISTLYFLKTKRFLFAFMFGFATALTRVIGVFLIVPLGVYLMYRILKSKSQHFKSVITKNWKYLFVSIGPLLGFSTYSFYLWKTTGDPFYFFSAQESFGAHRSTHLILPPQVIYRYIKIFITADKNFQYFVAVIELLFYISSLSLLAYDLIKQLKRRPLNIDRLGLNFFSFINILIPSLTGTLTAVPRYTLLSLSIYFVLAEVQNKFIKYALLVGFIIFHIIFLALFVQGYYIT